MPKAIWLKNLGVEHETLEPNFSRSARTAIAMASFGSGVFPRGRGSAQSAH